MKWWDKSWNPVVGCTACSPGCVNCYARTLHTQRYDGPASGVGKNGRKWKRSKVYDKSFSQVQLVPDRMGDPLKWRKPQTVFVCNMSDLHHPTVPRMFLDKVYAIIALCPQCEFIVCTKRPEALSAYWNEPGAADCIYSQVSRWLDHLDGDVLGAGKRWDAAHKLAEFRGEGSKWTLPLANLTIGTTAENQAMLDERLGFLLACPAVPVS